MRYTLTGGHSAGRVVDLDGPAPVFLQVAYREPCTEPDDPGHIHYPGCVTFGVDTYELYVIPSAIGPPGHVYVGPDLRK